jgi:microcin C transport system permease protein
LRLFACSLCAELIANDKPLLVQYRPLVCPGLKNYSESDFGGPLPPPPTIRIRGCKSSWTITAGRSGRRSVLARRALICHHAPFPSPPSTQNWLGTDANGGDVLARILYTRISILFGLLLTLFSSVMGVLAGAVQGITAEKSTSGASVY